MSEYEIVGEPFVQRIENNGGFSKQQRLMVLVQDSEGKLSQRLASEVIRSPKGKAKADEPTEHGMPEVQDA